MDETTVRAPDIAELMLRRMPSLRRTAKAVRAAATDPGALFAFLAAQIRKEIESRDLDSLKCSAPILKLILERGSDDIVEELENFLEHLTFPEGGTVPDWLAQVLGPEIVEKRAELMAAQEYISWQVAAAMRHFRGELLPGLPTDLRQADEEVLSLSKRVFRFGKWFGRKE